MKKKWSLSLFLFFPKIREYIIANSARKAKIEESDEISDGVIVDYDSSGKPVGIEFLDAAKLFGGHKELQVEMALTEDIKR